MKLKNIITVMALSSLSVACVDQVKQTSGIDISNLDTSVRSADDFYQFACGGWMENNPLPAAYARYGSFDVLGEENNKRINGILDELLHGEYAEGTTEKKLSDLYKLAMDSVRRNEEGVNPAMDIIQQMEQAKTKEELFQIQLHDLSAKFLFYVVFFAHNVPLFYVCCFPCVGKPCPFGCSLFSNPLQLLPL